MLPSASGTSCNPGTPDTPDIPGAARVAFQSHSFTRAAENLSPPLIFRTTTVETRPRSGGGASGPGASFQQSAVEKRPREPNIAVWMASNRPRRRPGILFHLRDSIIETPVCHMHNPSGVYHSHLQREPPAAQTSHSRPPQTSPRNPAPNLPPHSQSSTSAPVLPGKNSPLSRPPQNPPVILSEAEGSPLPPSVHP